MKTFSNHHGMLIYQQDRSKHNFQESIINLNKSNTRTEHNEIVA